MGGKGASSTVTVHNGPVTVDADSTVEVLGLNAIKLTLALYTETQSFGTPAPVELIVPIPVLARTNVITTVGGAE